MSGDDDPTFRAADAIALVTLLLVGVVGSGLVRRWLGLLGFQDLGRLAFVVGYTGMVFAVWYVWVRPLDLTGPSGDAAVHEEESDEGTEL